MSIGKRMINLAAIIAIVLWAPKVNAASTGEDVQRLVDSLRTQFHKVEDYEVRITVSLKMPRLRMPRKRITLSFKQPDKYHIESVGFAMLPRRGIMPSPDSLFSKIAEPVIIKTAGGGRCNCVIVRGVSDLVEDEITVTEVSIDTVRWVVLGVSTYVSGTAIFDMQSEYLEVEPGIFMPQKTSINFQLTEDFLTRGSRRLRGATEPADPDHPLQMGDDLDEIPRSGEAVIEFSRYRVNRGIEDSLFEEE